jgi:hypothetical protein
MGSSPRNSVVDQSLRLHTGDNIYVMDGSVSPTSASTRTMIPIMGSRQLCGSSYAGVLNRFPILSGE